MPPKDGVVKTNYGSDSGSLLFYQRLEEISWKQVMVAEEFFKFKFFCSCKKNTFQANTTYVRVGAGSGAGAVIRIYPTPETEPKEIFTAQQHNHTITSTSSTGTGIA
jgi:hypothetical protein